MCVITIMAVLGLPVVQAVQLSGERYVSMLLVLSLLGQEIR